MREQIGKEEDPFLHTPPFDCGDIIRKRTHFQHDDYKNANVVGYLEQSSKVQ